MKWDSWPDEVKKKWDIPMNLGEPARKAIKGNSLNYYLDALHQAREKSLAEFRKRDDKWLATVVTDGDFTANNYAKWFHVAEHESNHDGQIKFLKSRVPGAKVGQGSASGSGNDWVRVDAHCADPSLNKVLGPAAVENVRCRRPGVC